MTMRTFKLPFGYSLLVWQWTVEDKRQKKPTRGIGFIIEKLSH